MIQSKTHSANPSILTNSSATNQSLKKPISKIKESTQQEFYLKRFAKIKEILDAQGLDLNLALSERELLNLLDALGKTPFDIDIAAQLFDRIPVREDLNQSHEKIFVLRDFIDTHIKAEYLLLLQAEETENELNRTSEQINKIKQETLELKTDPLAAEAMNSLQVDIKEVACDDPNFKPEKGSTYSVIVVLDRYKYETDEVRIDGQQFNPVFNRTFHLQAKSAEENVRILLRDYKKYSSDPKYVDLKCVLSLEKFEDQQKHSEWFYFSDGSNKLTKFKVNATIQWQFASLEGHQETLQTLIELHEKLNENKESIAASLKALVHPFAKASSTQRKSSVMSRNSRGPPQYMQQQQQQQAYYSHDYEA